MIRRRLTLKRVDPWSVMKFGAVLNLALLAIGLIGFGIIWAIIRRLDLIEKFCTSVGDLVLDLQVCEVNGGALFGRLLVLGLLGVIVQTGIMVFLAFLYNLIADLTGGLQFGFLDESGDMQVGGAKSVRTSDTSQQMRTGGSGTTSDSMRSGGSGTTSGSMPAGSSGSAASASWSSQPDETTRTSPATEQGDQGGGPASSGSGGWRPGDGGRDDDPIFGRRDSSNDDTKG